MVRFNVRPRFRIGSLRIDRVSAYLNEWVITGDYESVFRTLHEVTVQPEYLDEPVQVFQRVTSGEVLFALTRSPRVRGGVVPRVAPLFQAKLAIISPRRERNRRAVVRAEVTFNPTRLVANGSSYAPCDLSDVRLFGPDLPFSQEGEFSLDNRGNVIEREQPRRSTARVDWPGTVARHLEAIDDLLDHCVARVANWGGTRVPSLPNSAWMVEKRSSLNLRDIETYVEIDHRDPTAFVRSNEVAFRSQTVGSDGETYEVRNLDPRLDRSEVDGNSRSLAIHLSRSRRLKLYAKTNRRLRFEIEHKLHEDCSVIGTAHTVTGRWASTLRTWVSQITVEAHEELSWAVTSLFQSTNDLPDNALVIEFVCEVAAELADPELTRTVVSLLSANGFLSTDPRNSPSEVVNAALALHRGRNPILVRPRPRTRSLVPSARYRPALEFLRQFTFNEEEGV